MIIVNDIAAGYAISYYYYYYDDDDNDDDEILRYGLNTAVY